MITSILFTKYSLLIDLHVLSILSAFILSQDQTLHSIYLHLYYSFSSKFFDRNCIMLFLFTSSWFAFLLILLFCFYCPFVMRIYFALTKIILPHYITLCQLLFLIFFVFFNIQINTLLSHIYFFCTFIDNNS